MSKTKQKLLKIGCDLLIKYGYGKFSVDFLLDKTKISKGSFYHHFKNKEEYILLLIDTYNEDWTGMWDQAINNGAMTYKEKIFKYYNIRIKYYLEGGSCWLLQQLLVGGAGNNPIIKTAIGEVITEKRDYLELLIRKMIEVKEIDSRFTSDELSQWISFAWFGALSSIQTYNDKKKFDSFVKLVFEKILV